MKEKDEIEVVEHCSDFGIKITANDKSIDFSPEMSQQICTAMVGLGAQLVAKTGAITVEYFKTQANMYQAELDTYFKNQTLNSDERKMILKQLNETTEEYSKYLKETDDPKKREALKENYLLFYNTSSEMYLKMFDRHSEERMPGRIDLLHGLRKLLKRNK